MRIGVNVSNRLHNRMRPYKDQLNVSELCRDAIRAAVEEQERLESRIVADGMIDVVDKFQGDEPGELWFNIDWEEHGWNDARDWLKAATRDQFDDMAHFMDVLERDGRKGETIPGRQIEGSNNFMRRWFNLGPEYDEDKDRIYDAGLENRPEFNSFEMNKRYNNAWWAYATAVRKKLAEQQREEWEKSRKNRTPLPTPEIPDHLVNSQS